MSMVPAKVVSGAKATGRFLISTNFLAALAIVTLVVVVFVAVRSSQGLATASQARQAAAQARRAAAQTQQSSDRRDCVTTLSTARRSVFDNVDIYKAEAQTLIFNALLDLRVNGAAAVPEAQVAAIKTANDQLDAALVEAKRLQPAGVLNDLIAHGGMIDGVHYDGCPAP